MKTIDKVMLIIVGVLVFFRRAIPSAVLFLVSCGPVPWEPCSPEQKDAERCSGDKAEVEQCTGRYWTPTINCKTDLTGPDGEPVVKTCEEKGGNAQCQSN